MLLEKYINVFPQIINHQQISCIIKCANHISFNDAQVGQAESGGGIVNKKVRDVRNYSLTPIDKSLTVAFWAQYLNTLIVENMNNYLKNHRMDQTYGSIPYLNQLDILKYEEKNHYKYHIDDGRYLERTLSAILFLNNDYEGGTLHFSDTNLEGNDEICIKGTPGSLVVWPSNMLFPHAVAPVTKGTRYTIVAWAK